MTLTEASVLDLRARLMAPSSKFTRDEVVALLTDQKDRHAMAVARLETVFRVQGDSEHAFGARRALAALEREPL